MLAGPQLDQLSRIEFPIELRRSLDIDVAGFSAIGINGGNIRKSGVESLCLKEYDNFLRCTAINFVLINIPQ